eukprot:scaffold32142_cov90-Isochrysis_galbana.AAC.4
MARPQETPLNPHRLNFGSTPLQHEPAPRHVYTFEEAQRRRSPAVASGGVTAMVGEEQTLDLSLSGAIPQAPELGQQHSTAGKEIRLWDPSFIPLNARSVSQEDYVPHPLPPMATPTRAEYVQNSA